MSKRTSSQFSVKSGVKRIRCGANVGENSSEGQAESEPPDDDDHDGHDHDDTDTIDEVMECLSDCCKPDREGPNQPRSTQVLAATKRMQSHQARYVQASWFSQHLFVRQESFFLLLLL